MLSLQPLPRGGLPYILGYRDLSTPLVNKENVSQTTSANSLILLNIKHKDDTTHRDVL